MTYLPCWTTTHCSYSHLPKNLSVLQAAQRATQSRDPEDQSKDEEEVDFERLGIGVHSREMDIEWDDLPDFIIPRRIYILDLDCPPSGKCESASGEDQCAGTC